MKLQSRCLCLCLQSSEYLTGAGVSTSKRLIHMAVALPHCEGLFSQHASRFPPEQVIQERQSQCVLWPSLGSDITSLLSYTVGHSTRLDTVWEGITQGYGYQETRIIGGHFARWWPRVVLSQNGGITIQFQPAVTMVEHRTDVAGFFHFSNKARKTDF